MRDTNDTSFQGKITQSAINSKRIDFVGSLCQQLTEMVEQSEKKLKLHSVLHNEVLKLIELHKGD